MGQTASGLAPMADNAAHRPSPGKLSVDTGLWLNRLPACARRHAGLVAAAAIVLLAIGVAMFRMHMGQGAHLPAGAEQAAASQARTALPALPAALPPQAPGERRCGPETEEPPSDIEQSQRQMEEQMKAADTALDGIAASLAAGTSDRDRALGLYLQTMSARSAGGSRAGRLPSATDAQSALLRLATTTTDADAYALGMFLCTANGGGLASGACDQLSYAQWARIEPDNAVPWLYLAQEAEGHRDAAAVEAALNRASRARYSDPHSDQLSRLIASDATAALRPGIQDDLAGSLLSYQGGMPHPNLSVVIRYCARELPANPARAQACGDLAATLIERSRTPIEVLAGGRVAERVGWSDPRLARFRDEADAMRWEVMKLRLEPNARTNGSGCDLALQLRRDMALQAQVGEAGLLREQMSAGGGTVAQAAERWRALPRMMRGPETP
jgi:hypothetical protein